MLTELQDVIDFCEADHETDTKAISAIQDGVEKFIKNYCRNDFEETDYTEYYDGKGSAYLHLKHYPVINVTRLALGRRTAIRVKNTDAYTSATISVNSTGLIMTKNGVSDITVTFATYATMSAVVSAINALANGWSATIQSSSFSNFKSSELVEMYGKSAIDSTWVYLDIPEEAISDFEVYPSSGQIYYYGGWPIGYRNVYVKYTAGIETIPKDLQLGVWIFVKYIFQKKDEGNFGVKEYSLGDIKVVFGDDNFPIEAKNVINYYRRYLV